MGFIRRFRDMFLDLIGSDEVCDDYRKWDSVANWRKRTFLAQTSNASVMFHRFFC